MFGLQEAAVTILLVCCLLISFQRTSQAHVWPELVSQQAPSIRAGTSATRQFSQIWG